MPLFAIPISFLVLRETPKVNEIAGIVVGFIGVLVYASSLTVSVIGGTLTVINAIFWALFSVYYRKLRDYDPLVVNSSQFLLGSVFFLSLIPFDYRLDLSTRFLLDFSYSTFLGGLVMFLLWNLMLSVEKVNKVVVLIFSIPVFSTLFDYFRGVIEITPPAIGGIGIILSGLIISQLGKERKRLGIQAKRK